ncbi:MAG: DUF924 domain-containing protein [Rhodobacteraceae bacterium]|nr:DUF924 domain-containing protein [Paracoccaceae bacterium]
MAGPDEVLSFWLDEVGESRWYVEDKALDAEISDRFRSMWDEAVCGQHSLWLTYPTGALAYIILTDQFSRNMFRGEKRAFSSDKMALAAAKAAVDKGWDLRVEDPARQFFYMPLMHSENLCDQERCVRLMCKRSKGNLLHARAHREVIRQFGRFPFRNKALARNTTDPEIAYVAAGGYGATVRDLQAAIG